MYKFFFLFFLTGCSTTSTMPYFEDLYNCGPYAVRTAGLTQRNVSIYTRTVRKYGSDYLIWYNRDITTALKLWNIKYKRYKTPKKPSVYNVLLHNNTVIVSVNMQDIPYGTTRNKNFLTPFVYGHYLTIHKYNPKTDVFMVSDPVHKPPGRPYDAKPFVRAVLKWSNVVIAIPKRGTL